MTDQSWNETRSVQDDRLRDDSLDRSRSVDRGRNGIAVAALAAAGAALLAGGAEAQAADGAPDGFQAVSDIADVASIHVQADGSVQLVMADGRTVVIAASDVMVQDGIVYLADGSVSAALEAVAPAAAGGGGAALGILGAAVVGGGLAAGGGGGGGGNTTPTPTPTPNTNPPVFTSATTASVDENSTGTAYTATATDADGNTLTYAIVGGADAADFTINASTGAVTFVGAPDFEGPDDANADNTYELTIRASDGTNTTDQDITITVNDVDEAPVFSSGATASVAENQTAAYSAAAADDEGTALTYALSGTDAALFSIDSATGAVTFIAAPDYENPEDAGGDNVYDIVVSASDGTNTTDQAVAITVTDQNDNAPVFTSASSFVVPENQLAAFTATATDADTGATLTYSLSGADAAAFKIDANTGVVTFVAAPDYESPGGQSFDLVVTASDGVNTTDQSVGISVNNVDEAPVFTSGAAVSVQENQTAAYTAVASDPDFTSPTYSISGGADAALFNIDAVTGVVTFKTAPNFEVPGDAGGDNVYDIVVRASDATTDVDQAVAITVTDINDNAPVFTSGGAASVVEGTLAAYDADATDADASDTLVYSISGTDAALFNIDSATGEVTFKVAPDFELPADSGGDNVYDFVVSASDGTNSTNRTVAVTVTDGNENSPVFTSPATATMAENGTAAYTAVATDIDLDTLTYSISGGSDAALFAIDSATGEVSFLSAPDYEAPGDAGADNVYNIVVRASDGSTNTDQAVAITVTDLNDNTPVFTSGSTASVAENQLSAYTASATDADATSSVSYALSGTDAALFTINASTGVVQFVTAPDFESPSDSGGNNIYDFVVTASDGSNSIDQSVAVTVTDISENSDLPADVTTPATLALGETFSNQLEVVGDRDWIAVELVAGQRYGISLDGTGGSPLSDPLVRLYDAAGDLIAENDDGGPGLNSLLTYTVQTTGTYYVEAAAWDDTVAGSYTVGLETAAPLEEFTNDQIAEYLRSGYWVGNGSAPRHWNVTEGGTITVTLSGLTADGQTFARAALQLWSDLTGITFSEVGVGGQMVFDDDEDGAFATTVNSGGFIQSAEVNVSADWIDTYGTDLNSYSFQTYIHEIGHALGLGHAGPYNGAADYSVDASYLNDSWQATVMSYFSQTENTFVDASFALVMSPQMADVLAIQNMYGLATNIRAGDTVYGFNSTAGNAVYDATSFTTVTTYTIVDTGGTDTMDYSGSAANQTLDLRAEAYSSVQGGTGNVGIARGTVVENAIGGSGNDTMIGNDADNVLTGNAGADHFYASGGSDVYNGGAGIDTVSFTGLQSQYSVTTNGSGNTVVTDLRAGSPDGVTELIGIETIEYGTATPSAEPESAEKLVGVNLVGDGLADAGRGAWFAADWGAETNFVGLAPEMSWGLNRLPAEVMRPFDVSSMGDSTPVVGLADGGDKAGFDHPVMDALEVAEKPVAHHDVMPALTAAEIAQVQLIDGEANSLGVLLTDSDNAELFVGGFADNNAIGNLIDFNLPGEGWDASGMATLTDGQDPRGAGPVQAQMLDSGELTDLGSPAISFSDQPLDIPHVDTMEGWA
ncbi:cadherin domain-containing protein [Maricaulis sp.]|uniref:cadherin domain-containing protein n=1 Tax=Maricaulis sp. TaxID=1486257 RepID=UPI003A8CB470